MMLRNRYRVATLLAAAASLSSNIAHGQTLTLTLTPSQHNGYNISCPGGKDGSIDLTVTGGTAPYTYEWSNLAVSVEDQTTLEAGYYHVEVHDAQMLHEEAEITLTEPDKFELRMEPYEYPNGYNVSIFDAFNGSIDVTVLGGVAPYTYLWQDGATTADRTTLGAGNYYFELTDLNNCVASSEVIYLTEPERNDWTMTGNANTNPGTQYIGTSDNKDVVFKTNATEALRLLSTGQVRAPSLAQVDGYRLIGVDPQGNLRAMDDLSGTLWTDLVDGCPAHDRMPWTLCGNVIKSNEYLGTNNARALVIKTDAVERMRVTAEGRVGIGTTPPTGSLGGYRLYVEDGIVCRDVLMKHGTWPDFVFEDSYQLMSLDELRDYLRLNHHLPGIPSKAEVEAKDGVEVGDLQTRMLKVDEEQTLYILQLEERLRVMEQRMKALEASR